VVDQTERLDLLFEALANRHRREIVYLLALQPESISRLAQLRDLSLPAIHKHIAVLEEAGLVSRRKTGRTTYLTLRREPMRAVQTWLTQFNPFWGSDGETLANYAAYLQSEPSTTPEEQR
jgi:DNA-binding transcriptional ArsR family regulator